MALTAQVENRISMVVDEMLSSVQAAANGITLTEILDHKNPIIRELFNMNADEYIWFFVMERVERSFVTKLGHVVEDIVRVLIESQGGTVVGRGKKDWQPYDLKFKLFEKEYWIEIKSILGQNKSNWQSIDANRQNAREHGVEFRLGVYYETAKRQKSEDDVLIGQAFWSFVGGAPDTQQLVFEKLRGRGRTFSLRSVVNERTQTLINEMHSHSNMRSIPHPDRVIPS